MNNLSATGNAGNDAEVRFTSDGTAIASWSIALTSGYGKNEKTTWLRCNMFGKRGETIAQYIKKGTTNDAIISFFDNCRIINRR